MNDFKLTVPDLHMFLDVFIKEKHYQCEKITSTRLHFILIILKLYNRGTITRFSGLRKLSLDGMGQAQIFYFTSKSNVSMQNINGFLLLSLMSSVQPLVFFLFWFRILVD